jgi:hypothetical protein
VNTTTNYRLSKRLRAGLLATGLLASSAALAGCGGSSGSATPASTDSAPTAESTSNTTGDTTAIASGAPVLPVAKNPITNTSTVQALTIDSVLVENNVDTSGQAVSDHLEIALSNTGTAELSAFESFYTFTDPTTSTSESYYAQLPASFAIPAGGTRIAHFDNTGAVDHFPVNEFSLYYTDTNAMDVTVTVSATDAAAQTTTIQKDAGGPETAD